MQKQKGINPLKQIASSMLNVLNSNMLRLCFGLCVFYYYLKCHMKCTLREINKQGTRKSFKITM